MGVKGREWALSEEVGFTSKTMCERTLEAIEETMNSFKPRNTYEVIDASDYVPQRLRHPLIY